MAGSNFQSVAFRLTPGDVIRFEGTLSTPTVGGPRPEIDLMSLECVSCDQGRIVASNREPVDSADLYAATVTFLLRILQGTVDFVLPPFVRLNITQLAD